MTILEDAIKKMDEAFKINPNFKTMSTNEIALAQATNILYQLKEQANEENRRHILAMRRIERQQSSLHSSVLIMSGDPGFLLCPQGWNNLQSGFTCIQEIIRNLVEPNVTVHMSDMSIPFGMELWAIDERGMMTLQGANRDSSD